MMTEEVKVAGAEYPTVGAVMGLKPDIHVFSSIWVRQTASILVK